MTFYCPELVTGKCLAGRINAPEAEDFATLPVCPVWTIFNIEKQPKEERIMTFTNMGRIYTYDRERKTMSSDNPSIATVKLSPTQTSIFETLLSDPNKVFGLDTLYLAYKKYKHISFGTSERKQAGNHILRLSAKLEDTFGKKIIFNKHGVGYTLTPPEQ